MKLDPNLAQTIVDKMMENIPYNINMMNEKGVIIASGDKKRLNSLHIGAIDTIKSGKTKPMIESYGKFGQPGVNIPVEFKHQTIGVIGITGDPKKVTPLASLLKVSTELLISQLNDSKLENQHKETLNHFLYQWTNTDNVLENDELSIRAHSLNIDLSLPRFAVIIETNNTNGLIINQSDFHFNQTAEQILIITKKQENIEYYLAFCQKNHFPIGISNRGYNLKQAVKEAQATIKVTKELNLTNIYYFQQIKFSNELLNSNLYSDKYLSVFKNFLKTKSGNELLETLECYFKHNGNVTDTSQALQVHRNTTNYRLNKISEFFELNLHDLTDIFQLYINFLQFKKQQYHKK
ncbi:CdaR family transcriptional regulator [Companilactobacillus halodurans]|nr:sugar diacid recognition domain-containing protein [Companilactobacillus halodurans]